VAVTKEEWAEQCRTFRTTIGGGSDDDLRSFTLGANRAAVRDDNSLDEVRAILAGLDEALASPSP
jgi:hypothetical protein